MRIGRAQIVSGALVLATAVVYLPVLRFGFINYDDQALLRFNAHLVSGFSLENVRWAVTSTDHLQWAPVAWLSHMLDFQLFGSDPSGHHLVNLLFHIFNVLALLAFLWRTTGQPWKSALVAALFALHPLQVEPVAWLSARKDLISTAWLFLALLTYAGYTARPTRARYLLTLAAYILSLCAKPMFVTLPLLLLVIDSWPLARSAPLGRLIVEKIPFAAAAAVGSAIAYLAQASSAAVTPFQLEQLPFRVSLATVAVAHQAWKTAWPSSLAVIYPRPPSIPPSIAAACAAFLVAISLAAIRLRRSKPALFAGWSWFLIGLLPVTGLIQIGPAMTADKYMYVPIAGLFIAMVWSLPGTEHRRWRTATIAGALCACALATSDYLRSWKSDVSLYTRAIAATENNYLAMSNLGAAYELAGDLESALGWYRAAIRAEPRFEVAYANIGFVLLMSRHDCEHATPYFVTALSLNPGEPRARAGLMHCARSVTSPR